MTDDAPNLDPLDPTSDPSFDARVRASAADAMAARAARLSAPATDVFATLGIWMRPALAAAAVVVAVGLPALAGRPLWTSSSRAEARAGSTADILGIPPSLMSLTRSREAPSVAQLAAAVAPSLPDDGVSHGR